MAWVENPILHIFKHRVDDCVIEVRMCCWMSEGEVRDVRTARMLPRKGPTQYYREIDVELQIRSERDGLRTTQ